jgi:16S rRNA (uracil1498-N3)-methyltransferase
MQNLPRIFISEKLETGKHARLSRDQFHYLSRVMRAGRCLVFSNGEEFVAELASDSRLLILGPTKRPDPSNNLTLAFAPIKQARMEEMLNSAAQMGVAKLQPVITSRTVERHPKWARVEKIIIEASEQSGRNSIPELQLPQTFGEFMETREGKIAKDELFFADERLALRTSRRPRIANNGAAVLLIGPEGGFSPAEFSALDACGAIGISLGPTILRAETAAVAAISALAAASVDS